MDRAELEQKIEKLREKLTFVQETWQKTGNRELLNFIVELGPKLFNCERVSIFVHDPAANHVWLLCGTSLRERQIIVEKSNSVVGQAIQTRRVITKLNMIHQRGAHQDVDLETGFMTRNAMSGPILDSTGDRVIGAMELLNKRNHQNFEDDDREYLLKIVDYIENPLENIYQRQELVKIAHEIQMKINKLNLILNPLGGNTASEL